MEANWWPWWVTTTVALVVVAAALVVFFTARNARLRGLVAVVALLGLAAAIIAPFLMDGTEDRLTRQEFARRADANCDALNRFAATLGPANTLPQTERYMNRFLPEFRKRLAAQDDLVPPEADEARADRWMSAMEAIGEELEALREAAERRDQRGVAAANRRSSRHVNESARLSKQLGMRVCFS